MAAPIKAKDIRRIIGHVDGAWVRVWQDGECWAGISVQAKRYRKCQATLADLKAMLEAAGYRVKQVRDTLEIARD